MKKIFLLTIILYFNYINYLIGQENIYVKNVYFFGHLDYTKDEQICEKSVWVNVLNQEADMCQRFESIKRALSYTESSNLGEIKIGESTHEEYMGTIGVGKIGESQHVIIYDPNIFIKGEEEYVSSRRLFKYLILAHEIAHILYSHTDTCTYNSENNTFRNIENDADYRCGAILAWLKIYKRSDVKRLLDFSDVEDFLVSENYSSIKQRKLTILTGFDYGAKNPPQKSRN